MPDTNQTEPLQIEQRREQLLAAIMKKHIEIGSCGGYAGWHILNDPDVLEAFARHRLLGQREMLPELIEQWRVNHFEHSRHDWPHDGECHWPLPAIIDRDEAIRAIEVG